MTDVGVATQAYHTSYDGSYVELQRMLKDDYGTSSMAIASSFIFTREHHGPSRFVTTAAIEKQNFRGPAPGADCSYSSVARWPPTPIVAQVAV
jgi:hypothetical protein